MEFLAENHPNIIHFPIALLITYCAVELFGIIFNKDSASKSAYVLLCIGIFFSFLAAITGNEAINSYKNWNEITSPVIENHQTYANITIWYFTFVLIFRTVLLVKKKFNSKLKYIFILLLPVGVYFIILTAKFGGELMHKYGVGTEIKMEKSVIND